MTLGITFSRHSASLLMLHGDLLSHPHTVHMSLYSLFVSASVPAPDNYTVTLGMYIIYSRPA